MSTLADLELAQGSSRRVAPEALAGLGRAVAAAARAAAAPEALRELAEAARVLAGADVSVIRVLEPSRSRLEVVAVAGRPTLAAELAGSSFPLGELGDVPLDDLAAAPAAVRLVAERIGASAFLLLPVRHGDEAASLGLFRAGPPFSPEERLAAELGAAQIALVLRVFSGAGAAELSLARPALELAGEALAATLDDDTAAEEIVRVAAGLAGARAAILWECVAGGTLRVASSCGLEPDAELGPALELAERTLAEPGPVRALPAELLPEGCGSSTTLPLGRPPLGVLQLLNPPGAEPTADQLAALATFGVRAAHALRASERSRVLALELQRARALLAVLGQATAELSVSHTLETVVERIAELLAAERVSVYLRGADGALVAAAARGLEGVEHEPVGERLLDLALGPARGLAVVEAHDPRVGGALGVPLLVRDDVVGLLAVYPETARSASEHETALLSALAGQLAVAVQNAQLHEQATRLGREREAALDAERAAARQLRALYEVSRSFAQSLSLEETLKALARTVVEVLDVDAALVRMPDERREQLIPHALHVSDPTLEDAMHAILFRPQPFGSRAVQRLFRDGRPIRIRRPDAAGGTAQLLAPFLEKGWTAATVPVALPHEVMAALSIFSFRPGTPIGDETIEAATALAGQAALAIDNARLYQQQKHFADTMQRSLLPRTRPDVSGLEVGEVYESSARVDVGGDVYDFLVLPDGRLAVVLGDVTGHGVESTADMAMAKFVFRSLAREHPEPADFLASANEVVCGEIAPGKFITMAYVAIDAERGRLAYASAGHPAARIVLPGGEVRALDGHGLVLGIDGGQSYETQTCELPPGAMLVLYTDGLVEARRREELFGFERVDELLAQQWQLSPLALAYTLAGAARDFAGGELADDLAVVVIRRTIIETGQP
ncbi:MAG TPA: SpoIIE family protein phosphatase [Gaiellaceae bacterium]|nr:SpoIIE family protein phosphatase [Gaiellaceae bacterium]